MRQKQRNAHLEKIKSIPDSEERLLIATGKYLGERFDDARLDTLFLAVPISWKETLAQYAGRLHRIHYNKKEVRIYDYVDSHVPMLVRMHKRRMKGYKTLGYEVGEHR
jgi:superfamily II DNA or RNA helicase